MRDQLRIENRCREIDLPPSDSDEEEEDPRLARRGMMPDSSSEVEDE